MERGIIFVGSYALLLITRERTWAADFLIFINGPSLMDLENEIRRYADDTSVYSTDKAPTIAALSVNQHLHKIES